MSKEQIRELLTMQSTDTKVAHIWFNDILNGNLPQQQIQKCFDIPVSRLVMIGGLK
jgi:hypothetical protein